MVKKTIYILICLVCLNKLTAQECLKENNDSIEIIFAVDAWPEFNKKGTKGLDKFIKENIRRVNVPEGDSRVVVQFLVDTIGFTSRHKIIKSVDRELDNEAMRISKLLRFMNSATQRGKLVNFIYTLTFDFKRVMGNVSNRELSKQSFDYQKQF